MPFGDGVDGGGGRGATERKTTPRPRSAMPAPVLLVEDVADGCEIMRLLQEDAGYTMLEAEGGDAALELLREPAPRGIVVVLDLRMRQWIVFELLYAVVQEPALAERHAYVVSSAHKR